MCRSAGSATIGGCRQPTPAEVAYRRSFRALHRDRDAIIWRTTRTSARAAAREYRSAQSDSGLNLRRLPSRAARTPTE
jgi:hypothetical protein